MKIEKGKRYFMVMRPIRNFYGNFLDKQWVECEITDKWYNLSDRCMVELKSLDPAYGKQIFYRDDFLENIKDGFIIEKTSSKQHVEHIEWLEPLGGKAYLHHYTTRISE